MPTPTLITTLPEYGSLESVPLCAGSSASNYAWMATDLADVRQPARLRGKNRVKPGAHGVTATKRYKTESRRLIPMLFTGDCESDGTAAIHDRDEQVWINFYEFVGLVLDPDGTTTRTLTVVHKSLGVQHPRWRRGRRRAGRVHHGRPSGPCRRGLTCDR
jgi:hypothetical protein